SARVRPALPVHSRLRAAAGRRVPVLRYLRACGMAEWLPPYAAVGRAEVIPPSAATDSPHNRPCHRKPAQRSIVPTRGQAAAYGHDGLPRCARNDESAPTSLPPGLL